MELLPPLPGMKGNIDPEDERAPEDRYNPAVPGIAGKRERFRRRSLDERVKEAAHDGPYDAQYHR